MRRFEMNIFEEMNYIVDKFFTDLDNTIIHEDEEEEESEETPLEEEEEEKFDAWEVLTPWERNATLSGFLGGMY